MKRDLALTIAGTLLVAVNLLIQGGCGTDVNPDRGRPADDPLAARTIIAAEGETGLTATERDGRDAFEKYCVICHGSGGKGDGFNAYNIDPKPADLTSLVPEVSDEHILSVIESGSSVVGQSPLCPPTGVALGTKRSQSIVAYLRKLAAEPQ
jgi:mono/diheme cytochrome c family protein